MELFEATQSLEKYNEYLYEAPRSYPKSKEIQRIILWSSVELPKIHRNTNTLFMHLFGITQSQNKYKESLHGAPWRYPKFTELHRICSWSSVELPKVQKYKESFHSAPRSYQNFFMELRGATQSRQKYKRSLHGALWSYTKSREIQGSSSWSSVELPKVFRNKKISSWISMELPKDYRKKGISS